MHKHTFARIYPPFPIKSLSKSHKGLYDAIPNTHLAILALHTTSRAMKFIMECLTQTYNTYTHTPQTLDSFSLSNPSQRSIQHHTTPFQTSSPALCHCNQ